MASEFDLWAALVAIAEADTGAGGLVTLCRKPNPLVVWGDSGMRKRPVITGLIVSAPRRSGTANGFRVRYQFDAHVERTDLAEGLASRILDRLEERVTQAALAAQGIDAAPTEKLRRDLPSLEEGGMRKAAEYEFLMTRS